VSDQPKIEIGVDADFQKVSQDLQDLMSTFTKVSSVIKPLADSMNSAFSGNTLKVIESMGASIKGLSDSVGTLTGRIKEMHKELGLTMPQMAQQAGFAQTQVSGAAAALGGGSGGGGPSSGGYISSRFGGGNLSGSGGGGIQLGSLMGALGGAKIINDVGNIISGVPRAMITARQNEQFGLMDAVRGDATNLMIAKYGENVPGQGTRTFVDFLKAVGSGAASGGVFGGIPGAVAGGAVGLGSYIMDSGAREARNREEQLQYNKMLGDSLSQSTARAHAMHGAQQSYGAAFGNLAGRSLANSSFLDIEGYTGDTQYTQDLLNRYSSSGAIANNMARGGLSLASHSDFERMYGTGMGSLARTMMSVQGTAVSEYERNQVMSQLGGFENDMIGRDIIGQTAAGMAAASPLMYQDAGSIAGQVGQVGQVLNFGKSRGFDSAAAQSAIAGQTGNVNQSIYGGGYVQMKMYAEMRKRGIPESQMAALVGRAMVKGRLDESDFATAEKMMGASVVDKEGLMNLGQETMRGIFGSAEEAQGIAEGAKMGQADQTAFGAAYAGSIYGKRSTTAPENIPKQATDSTETKKNQAEGLAEITKTIQASAEDFRRMIGEGTKAAAKDISEAAAGLRRSIVNGGTNPAINGIKR